MYADNIPRMREIMCFLGSPLVDFSTSVTRLNRVDRYRTFLTNTAPPK